MSAQSSGDARVVVGVDGSDDSGRALDYAARQALVAGGSLHLVHAVDDAVVAGAWGVVHDVGALEEAGRESLAEATARALDLGVPAARVSSEVCIGNAASVLVRAAARAQRLVVGRRRKSGLERMFVGSTSVSLAATSPCPLVVISASSTPQETGGRGVVAVGLDGQARSERTLVEALAEARGRPGSRLLVTHALPSVPETMFGGYRLTDAAEREALDSIRDQLARLVERVCGPHPEIRVDIEVGSGDPVDTLIDLTRRVDLLVLGIRAPAVLGFAMGGVTRAVMAHAASPLLVVR